MWYTIWQKEKGTDIKCLCEVKGATKARLRAVALAYACHQANTTTVVDDDGNVAVTIYAPAEYKRQMLQSMHS